MNLRCELCGAEYIVSSKDYLAFDYKKICHECECFLGYRVPTQNEFEMLNSSSVPIQDTFDSLRGACRLAVSEIPDDMDISEGLSNSLSDAAESELEKIVEYFDAENEDIRVLLRRAITTAYLNGVMDARKTAEQEE